MDCKESIFEPNLSVVSTCPTPRIVLVVAAAARVSAQTVPWECFGPRTSSTSGTIPSFDAWKTRHGMDLLALALFSLAMLCSTPGGRVDRNRLRGGVPGLFVHAAVADGHALVGIASWASKSSLGGVWGKPGFYQPRWTGELLFGLHLSFQRDAAIAVLVGWLALVIVGR